METAAATAPPPTVEECCEWVSDNVTSLETDDDVAIELDSLSILVNALDAPLDRIQYLQERIKDLKKSQKVTLLSEVIKSAQEICNECRKCITSAPSYVNSCFIDFNLELPRILPVSHPTNYISMWPDQMDARAYWFRQYFVGKPYITLIGRSEHHTTLNNNHHHTNGNNTNSCQSMIISVVKERVDSKYRYRIICRGKQMHSLRHVVQESIAKEIESSLEIHDQGYFLDTHSSHPDQQQQQQRRTGSSSGSSQPRRRPLRSISSAIIHNNSNNNNNNTNNSNGNNNSSNAMMIQNSETRLFRAAVRSIYPDIDLRTFRELSAEATILSGLEKDILRFDEMEIPKCYKFGVLSVRDGQTTEEEWFANSNVSEPLERFLHIIGRPIELEGYKGYTAGLDTRSGESGKFSYATSWRDYEIMFHVAPLMPCRENDKQQVHRKRYIGNDIVCIVFIEGNDSQFDPDIIRSQFLHVYILVHPEIVDGKQAWRIQVMNKKNVSEYSPLIPSPSILLDEDELRGFLLLKMINAENAALKCDSFTIPNSKARAGVLKALSETGLRFTYTAGTPPRHHHHYYDNSDRMMSDRPKSAGAQRISRGSMRSLRTALTDSNHHPRSMTPDAPPVPATSRSSMLRDWKNLTRRRSSGGQSPIDNHSTSGSSRGPSPLLTHRPILLDDTEVNHHPINNINNNNSITVTTTDNNQSLLLVEEKTTTFRNNNHLNGHQNNHSNHSIHSINDNNNNNNNNENINTDSNHPHHNNNTKSRFSRSLSNDPLLLPPSSSTSQKQKPHSYQPTRPPSSQGSIRSKAQNLVTSVIGRRNSHHQQQQQQIRAATATTGGLIRSKTFMMDHAGKLIQGADRHEKL